MGLKKLIGLSAIALLVGVTAPAIPSRLFAEEAKQAETWALSQEEQELASVTNGDILGERGKDGVWEYHLYTADGYQEMTNGELVWVFGYTHAKGSYKTVGEVKTKEVV